MKLNFFWKRVPVAAFSNQSKKNTKKINYNEALKIPRNILVKKLTSLRILFWNPHLSGKIKKCSVNTIIFPRTYRIFMINFLGVNWPPNLSTLGLIGFLETLCTVLIIGGTCFPNYGIERFYLVLTGLLSFLGHVFMVLSAKFEKAATLALIRKSFDVILAFFFQMLFFQVLHWTNWTYFILHFKMLFLHFQTIHFILRIKQHNFRAASFFVYTVFCA